ncbi:alkene reductase [Streptomyces sp. SID8379]|uniref:alkene reductase n=1 Tax=unclassified Streptomyces TaxID=2593676 RepID=UPI0003655C9D|nr:MULTISPECIES: alkene reductase [unclassified Streptomyces]MYW66578.1 alkene reductase [Streptomyces sp. SID8379]
MTTAFDPLDLSGTRIANRIAMAPMTRSRAGAGGTATDLTAEYYAQRASAGLIISEGVQPSAVGQGYAWTPGLHSEEQIASWRKVTDAVHADGGVIFAQIMHAGRISHPSLQPDGGLPVAPSAVAPEGKAFTNDGFQDFVAPRELTADEIRATIADFADAARAAIQAGFDGVELHGANGYLIHQFLAPGSNERTDEWGGSVENRARFAVEVVKAVAAAVGAERTALRISPLNPYNSMSGTDTAEVYEVLIAGIEPLGIAYLHVLEAVPEVREVTADLRKRFTGTFFLNAFTEGPTDHRALALIEDGLADVLTFGALFLANPDLPARLRTEGPYNTPDPSSFFGGDAKGYTDYPAR